jgi:hypothetical protein
MNKRIVSVVGGLVVVALLSVMVVGVVSAQEPVQPEVEDSVQPETSTTFTCPMYEWWQEQGNSGEFVRPWMDPNFECPADCPWGSNFVDENNDGINDNAPRAGNRWNQDDNTFGPGMGMNRWNQGDDTFSPGMMGRGSRNNNSGPGMGMNRWNQDDDTFSRGMMGRSSQNNNFGPGMGMGRGWSNR